MTATFYVGDAIEVTIWQGPTGMVYAQCPTTSQIHRGETLYDLAVNVQLIHGPNIRWEMNTARRLLKVWHVSMGRSRSIVAAPTKKAAAAAFGFSIHEMNRWASETGNSEAIRVAMSEPGQVFGRHNNKWGEEWIRVDRHHA